MDLQCIAQIRAQTGCGYCENESNYQFLYEYHRINHMHFQQGFKKQTKLGGVASFASEKIVFTMLFPEVFQCAGILRR
jgi:hypothetical protein